MILLNQFQARIFDFKRLRIQFAQFTLTIIQRGFEPSRQTEKTYKSDALYLPDGNGCPAAYKTLYHTKLFCTTKIENLHQIVNKF